jgi:subtilisin-like proprotein convertase family protein
MSTTRSAVAAGLISLAALMASASAGALTAIVAGPGFTIPDNDPSGASSTITVVPGPTFMDPVPPGGAIVTSVEVLIAIDHTFAGDLIYTLTSPTGATITLANRPGVPDQGDFGDSSNLSALFPIGFSDRSMWEAELMGSDCAGTDDVIRRDCIGAFNPDDPLSLLAGINMLGDWTLTVSDNAGLDTGVVQYWVLELDYLQPVPVPAAAWLFASGLLALVVRRRTR